MNDLQFLNYPGNAPISPQFNDIELVGSDFALISGPQRKAQDVLKILVTRVQSNWAYPDYGSALPTLPGSRNTQSSAGNSVILSQITDSIQLALGFIQQIETSVDPTERLQNIVSLSVQQGSDSRTLNVLLVLQTESGNNITTAFPLTTG